MARLTLTLLGGCQVRLDGGPPLALPTRKIQALLAYLALPVGREHSRDKLAALLWGELSEGRARNSLRQAVFSLRQVLEPVQPACLCVAGGTIALNPDAVDVDATRFEQLVREGTPAALERAVGLYRGDLLEGLTLQEPPFEEWLMGERERLRELAVEALAGLLAAQRAAGAVEAALQTGLRLVGLDPLQEPVHRTLMRLYAQLGRRGSALHHYQLCVGVLQRELGVEPEDETKQLYQEILQHRPAGRGIPEARTADGSPPFTNVPRSVLTVPSDSPLIGRDHETARLRAAFAEAVNGQGRVVVIVGEAGVGKTRMVAELAVEVHAVGGRLLIGRCHESERILPFGPWVDALGAGQVPVERTWLATLPLVVRRELGRLLPELGCGNGETATPPDHLKLFEGVALLLGHVAGRQPAVLVLEDLHWADEMSVRLLAFIAHRLSAWRLLVLATAREEELVDAEMLRRTLAELEREPHVTTVALGPLSRGDTLSLVQALSRPGSDRAAMARVGEQVWRTSEGNPFVVIEAMRAAAREALSPGLEGWAIPERIRDIIGRQLDRLDDGRRELVARAAVIGRAFEFGLLQHISGLGEEDAARSVEELIRRRVLHSVGERLDFTHDRVREVAYDRILAPRRTVLHRRVAEALATVYAGNLDAHHLALGLHYAEGEVWDQAIVHLRRAGIRAVERSANRDAAACFEGALAALAHLPETRSTLEQAFEIRVELRPALSMLGEVRRVRERLREAEALAEQLNDDRRRGQVGALMANAHAQLGDLDEALLTGARALRIARRLDDVRLRIVSTTVLEQAHALRGDYERVVELATSNIAALPADSIDEYFGLSVPPSIQDRARLVTSLAQLGRFAEAAEYQAQAIRLAERTQHAYTVASGYIAASTLYLLQGNWAQAFSYTEHRIAVLRTGNIAINLPSAVASSAWALAQLGEASEALTRLREAEQLVERSAGTGFVGDLGWVYYSLGRTCQRLGLDEAQRWAERAVESSPHQPGFVAHALHLLGDIATHPDRFDAERGEAHYRQALALAAPRGMRPLIAHCHLGLGTLYQRTGESQESREDLTLAAAMYREMDMPFWLERAEAEISAFDDPRLRDVGTG
jgi:DNA-binding SARP family transcriptional activator